MRVALLQMTSSDIPSDNLAVASAMLRQAKSEGAEFAFLPEVMNCLSTSRRHQKEVLQLEEDDETLPALAALCAELGIWLLIGSLGLKTNDPDGRFANRSFVISDAGEIVARYDKIHMFDVDVSPEETYRESEGYRPGETAVVAETPFGKIGMTICYDVRFGALHRALAQAGAQILTVPAAFSHVTGAAHWETLLRARAIETGCFVIAPAQTGTHPSGQGHSRRTHGHSMVVAPWGEVLVDAGVETGVTVVDVDLSLVQKARRQVPALQHDREFNGP
ncbi:carbon-nitrogen hydrolase family protein [Shimia sp. R10_1]|uniref:carbon-nitrogen hydrolase family protein n=1 Tax=Shimia sp. R10_1 TaxID=2821095 RepID=UPI001ADAFEC4|nr:carbon-nitrogen hydrolase family protein [Shimia sp. R10_1]MBO9473201.1 carbon-nitrogen hydrolase family protein [Shimia sp. R10_1]